MIYTKYIKHMICLSAAAIILGNVTACSLTETNTQTEDSSQTADILKVKNPQDAQIGQETFFAMGTAFTATYYGMDAKLLNEMLEQTEQCLTKTDQDISWRIGDSLVDKLNADHVVDAGAYTDIFRLVLEIADQTSGAFDPTILPVSELWKFDGEEHHKPADAEIRQALTYVDYHNIEIDDTIVSAKKETTMMELGAVGKGYALNKIISGLDRSQLFGGIISAGSSIAAFGTKPDGSGFRVGLRNPRGAEDEVIGIFTIKDRSFSTSGDYEKCFEEDGVRYHHILDARTGYPADSKLMSVTIIAEVEQSALCDALSTACVILGLDGGMALADTYGVTAVFVDTDYNVWYNNEEVEELLDFSGEKEGYKLLQYQG